MEHSKKKSRNFHFSTLEIRPLVPNISDKNRRLFLSLHGYISATKFKRAKCRDFSKLSKKSQGWAKMSTISKHWKTVTWKNAVSWKRCTLYKIPLKFFLFYTKFHLSSFWLHQIKCNFKEWSHLNFLFWFRFV